MTPCSHADACLSVTRGIRLLLSLCAHMRGFASAFKYSSTYGGPKCMYTRCIMPRMTTSVASKSCQSTFSMLACIHDPYGVLPGNACPVGFVTG